MAEQISDRYRCIFVHIPKAAGSSIEGSSIFQDQREKTRENIGGHTTALEFRRKYPEKYQKYFKFTLVRNPYARLVSSYFYLSRGGSRNPYDTDVFNMYFKGREKSFSSFCRDMLSEEMVNEVIHLKPQYKFICDDDMNIIVDFIGRQESFIKDAKRVFKILGLPYEHRHAKRGNNRHFSEYYEEGLRDKVFNLYRSDFELLGYDSQISRESQFLVNFEEQMTRAVCFSSRALRKLRLMVTASRKTT